MGQPGSLSWQLANERQTEAAGALLADRLAPFTEPLLLGLTGPLGAGKTTLARGLLKALGVSGRIKSPTYTLIEPYETTSGPVHHLDLYRLDHPGELEFLGLPDFLDEPGLVLVEWPAKAPVLMKRLDFEIVLAFSGERRTLRIDDSGKAASRMLASLPASFSA
ncbi:MAG: tRNA (adenosine(37)-N6)-threonylcarbamoyltransferase complex ATPase subunit type 1 TsaE [Proteobacteria bacterium]|nr:tRNA (adenosine(37)-N6)-threonylcarbamoyltransferase complex ATPase subunit type 1 TsaE [Pseudomonadota bacterium]